MTTPTLMPAPRQKFTDNNGAPLANGMLFTYAAGTSTPLAAFQDAAGTIQHQNPIRLDARGEATVYFIGNYKIDLKTSAGNQVTGYPVDNFSAPDLVAPVTALAAQIGASSGSNTVGFQPLGAGSVARTVQDKLRERVTVKDFGAKGDGATNDLAAFQAAIAYRAANGGGAVVVPAGTYNINAPLIFTSSGITLIGDGPGPSKIVGTFAAGDIICIGDGTANPGASTIEKLMISSSVVKTSGAAVRLRNGHNLTVTNVLLTGNLYNGVVLDGGPQHFLYHVNNFEISVSNIGIEVGPNARVADCWIREGIINGGQIGVSVRNVSGLYASEIDAISCADSGIAIIPGIGENVGASFFNTVLGDTCANFGWKIFPSYTGLVGDITFVGCWGASTISTTGAGLYIDGPNIDSVSNLQFIGFRAVNCKGQGILLAQGRNISFANCVASGNSQAGSAIYSGMYMSGAMTDIQIIGGIFGGYDGLPQLQGAGIVIGGTMDYCQIIGANTRGNVVMGINNSSTGTHNVVANNV